MWLSKSGMNWNSQYLGALINIFLFPLLLIQVTRKPHHTHHTLFIQRKDEQSFCLNPLVKAFYTMSNDTLKPFKFLIEGMTSLEQKKIIYVWK